MENDYNNDSTVTELVLNTSDIDEILFKNLGERRKDTVSLVFLIGVYCAIFVTGVIGNLSTCIVIWKNSYMHTVTNYYLFTLAVSDLLTIILGR